MAKRRRWEGSRRANQGFRRAFSRRRAYMVWLWPSYRRKRCCYAVGQKCTHIEVPLLLLCFNFMICVLVDCFGCTHRLLPWLKFLLCLMLLLLRWSLLELFVNNRFNGAKWNFHMNVYSTCYTEGYTNICKAQFNPHFALAASWMIYI